MVKAVASITPSARIQAEASAPRTVVDKLGRTITVRKMDALGKLRLFKACGGVNANNNPYLGMAMLASVVTQIDELPVLTPTSEAQIEALIGRLGDEGIEAVASVFGDEAQEESSEDAAKN